MNESPGMEPHAALPPATASLMVTIKVLNSETPRVNVTLVD
jgi:hypothetical protein